MRHAGKICTLAALGLVYGLGALSGAKYDVFPDFVPPQATVQTEAPGLVAEQVELLVTAPIEVAIRGANGVESVRSESIQGLSVVTVVFREGSDPFRARQAVAEALLDASSRLPGGVKAPLLTPLTSSTMDLLKLGFVSERLSPMQLRDFVEWTVRPRLLAVPGVARATVFGGEKRQIEVRVQPRELSARGLSLDDVVAAVRAASGVRGGGFVDSPNQRILVETNGQLLDAAALAEALVASPSAGELPVRVGDVADVAEGAQPAFGDAVIMGGPGVLLALSSQYGANTLEVTQAIESVVSDLQPLLDSAGVVLLPALHRPANFIESALHGIALDLAIGAVLVGLVLYAFLRGWRAVLVSFLSIPLALAVAVAVIEALGWTLNTMTLGGLAVALGVVVDDAIIDVENMMRRLRDVAPGSSRARPVLLSAALEVRTPVVYATLVTVVVLLPVLTLHGLHGSFFGPLAAAFMLATLASLLVAVLVTPALASLLLAPAPSQAEPPMVAALKRGHARALSAAMRWPRVVIATTIVLVAIGALLLPTFDHELLPPFREGHFVLQVAAPAGTSLEAMRHMGTRISRELLAIDGVRSVEQQIGRAEAGEDTWGPHRSEFHLELDPVDASIEESIEGRIQRLLASYPGLQTEVMTFLGDRIGESLSGQTAAVVIGVYGNELSQLDEVARNVVAVLRALPHGETVHRQADPMLPVVRVDLDQSELAKNGCTAVEVMDTVQTAYQGTIANQVYLADRTADVVAMLASDDRRDPEAVAGLVVRCASGRMAPLGVLSRIVAGEGRATILRDGGRRLQVVTANPPPRDVSGFVDRARSALRDGLRLPEGVHLEFSGLAAGELAARRELLTNSILAGAGIVLLLSMALRGPRGVGLVVATAPFALAGGATAVAVSGGVMSIGSLVGFVTLLGIAARNAILLIAHLDRLVHVDGLPWSDETALRAASERLVPILMTALVTALGLLPLAAGSGEAGREVQGPMAIVILGGLASSTALNLLVLPVLLRRYWRPAAPPEQPSPAGP